MKIKMLIIVLCFSVLFGIFGSVASANQNDLSQVSINYETDLGHEGRTKNQIVNELTQEGYSLEDATFYAKFDILAAQLTEKGIQFSNYNTDRYSELYVKANAKTVREKALDLDLKAINSLLKQNKALESGNNDIEKSKRINKAYNSKMNYEIKYPDGSYVQFYSTDIPDEKISEMVIPNTDDALLSGPWNESTAWYGSNFTATSGSEYTSTREWGYFAGVSTAKIKDILKWKHNNGSSTLVYVSDSGSSSYAGVVAIDIEYLPNHQTGYDDTGAYVLQGYTDVRFVVSGSFSGTFYGLGISVNTGAGWHQYCISEILVLSGPNNVIGAYGLAGQFL